VLEHRKTRYVLFYQKYIVSKVEVIEEEKINGRYKFGDPSLILGE
jgi:hypothetical protein